MTAHTHANISVTRAQSALCSVPYACMRVARACVSFSRYAVGCCRVRAGKWCSVAQRHRERERERERRMRSTAPLPCFRLPQHDNSVLLSASFCLLHQPNQQQQTSCAWTDLLLLLLTPSLCCLQRSTFRPLLTDCVFWTTPFSVCHFQHAFQLFHCHCVRLKTEMNRLCETCKSHVTHSFCTRTDCTPQCMFSSLHLRVTLISDNRFSCTILSLLF